MFGNEMQDYFQSLLDRATVRFFSQCELRPRPFRDEIMRRVHQYTFPFYLPMEIPIVAGESTHNALDRGIDELTARIASESSMSDYLSPIPPAPGVMFSNGIYLRMVVQYQSAQVDEEGRKLPERLAGRFDVQVLTRC